MEKQLARFGFFLTRVNGTLAWTHLGWNGYRIHLGKRTLRLEFRSVTQALRRKNLRGTWTKVETYPLPETARGAAALVRKIARVYIGSPDPSVRDSSGVGAHAPASVRSVLIHRSVVAGGGKVRGNPSRRAAFGYAPATRRGLLTHKVAPVECATDVQVGVCATNRQISGSF